VGEPSSHSGVAERRLTEHQIVRHIPSSDPPAAARLFESGFQRPTDLTKLRADDLALGAASWRGRGGTTVDSCQTCRQPNCVETRTHFVLHCSALAKTRRAYPEILAWIQNSRAERAFAMILLALPERAADDIERATVVGAYLQDLWSERAAILGLNPVQL
jgi:hypothetical protein